MAEPPRGDRQFLKVSSSRVALGSGPAARLPRPATRLRAQVHHDLLHDLLPVNGLLLVFRTAKRGMLAFT